MTYLSLINGKMMQTKEEILSGQLAQVRDITNESVAVSVENDIIILHGSEDQMLKIKSMMPLYQSREIFRYNGGFGITNGIVQPAIRDARTGWAFDPDYSDHYC